MSHQLNITRLGRLLKHRILLEGKRFLTYAAVIAAFPMVVIFLLSPDYATDAPIHREAINGWYISFLLISGFVITATHLKQLNTPEGRSTFLTLPASNTEKWLSSWLLTGPILVVVSTIAFYLLTALIRLLFLLKNIDVPMLDLSLLGKTIYSYFLFVHPVALLSSIAFNRNPVVKSIAAISVFSTLIGLASLLIVRVVFHEYYTGFFTMKNSASEITSTGFNFILSSETGLSELAVLSICTLLLLAASYFRFQEKEV